MAQKFETIDEYNRSLSQDVLAAVDEVRGVIRSVIPDADEVISYQIPTFKLDGKYVVYVSGWAEHVSMYPVPERDEQLLAELEPFRSGKGTLKFPLGKPLPHDLIRRTVEELLAEREERT